jgi:glyoxylase-like metal-dependent hydrolase (beta-lactamase superfamily II)
MIEDTDLQFSVRSVPGFHTLVGGSVSIDQELFNNQEIYLEENLMMRVMHTPGHSAGSVSLYLSKDDALFTGDAILLPGEMPIYEQVDEYLLSLRKIEELGAKILLSAWDEPKSGAEIPSILRASKSYIEQIDSAINATCQNGKSDNPIDFCKQVLERLKLPVSLANPLLVKTFQAHLD